MARKRTSMKKIRDIIRLKETTDMSERQIARALNVARTVVARYLNDFSTSGLNYEQIEQMADSQLLSILKKRKVRKNKKYEELAKQFPYFVKELKKKGVTLNLLWKEYKKKYPDGYENSQFCYHFQMWRNASEVTMHMNHKAGDKMFVDYAGEKLKIIDQETGKEQPVEVFVAILGCSQLTYVEASMSQQSEDWIRSNERALWYFNGVVQAIVPDNLRSAVSRSDRYEPGINLTYDDFAEYYKTVIIPARVREARDKALVENAVGLVYQRIYAPLRNRSFYSLEELNAAIWSLLEEHNNTPFQRLDISRREIFEEIEKRALKPLPVERYPSKTIKVLTVQINYHVELREDRHYYSVPYYLRKRGQKTKVKVMYDDRIVAIYYDNIRVAQHKRDRRPNEYSTLPEHRPPEHRWVAEWSSERFLRWAGAIGADVALVVGKVLESRKYPEQAFKVCMGILNLVKRYDSERLNKACRRAHSYGIYSYKRIENMLKQGLEEETQSEFEWGKPQIPVHENIRGSEYYN
jgi:transposase